MNTFRLVYLYAFLFDAVMSVVATVAHELNVEIYSQCISLTVAGMSLGVLILSKIGYLRPERVFFTMSLFYFFMLLQSMIVGAALVEKVGADVEVEGSILTFMAEQLPWFTLVHWITLLIWLSVAIWALLEFNRYVGLEKPADPAE